MATSAAGRRPSPLLLLMLLLLFAASLPSVSGSGSPTSEEEADAEPFFCDGPERRRVERRYVCDGVHDCDGREDEKNCTECKDKAWKCLTNPECISVLSKCDTVNNCPDHSDEHRTTCQLAQACAGSDRFKCANGVCVNAEERCDCHSVCTDGSDEWNCTTKREKCRRREFSCMLSGPPRLCLPSCRACDGHMDCPHGEDEKMCDSCKNGAFLCRSNVCIERFRRCDGAENCDGGEDELGCPEGGPTPVGFGRRPRHQEKTGRATTATTAAAATAGPPYLSVTLDKALLLLLSLLFQLAFRLGRRWDSC